MPVSYERLKEKEENRQKVLLAIYESEDAAKAAPTLPELAGETNLRPADAYHALEYLKGECLIRTGEVPAGISYSLAHAGTVAAEKLIREAGEKAAKESADQENAAQEIWVGETRPQHEYGGPL